MATKGPKMPGKPVAPKPVARAVKPAVPRAEAVASTFETSAPESVIEAAAPINAAGTVPAVEAVSQEVVETVQAAEEQAQAAAAHTANEAEAVFATATDATVKEVSTMETTIENNTFKGQAMFADMNERAKAAVEKSARMAEEAGDFAKGNLEAVVESGRIAAKGFESLGQDAAEYSRRSFENATSVMKTLATIKSPTDFFKLQSDFFRTSFDSYVAEASKNTEAMIKLAGDAAQPISNRFAVAIDKVKTAA